MLEIFHVTLILLVRRNRRALGFKRNCVWKVNEERAPKEERQHIESFLGQKVMMARQKLVSL